MKTVNKNIQTLGYTIAALIAFAANSVLCRIALKDNLIDASSFTAVRLLSGVLMFLVLFSFKSKSVAIISKKKVDHWKPALMLFVYALAFSFAYISLETGAGALVLFGAVQLTMVVVSIINGKKLHLFEWLGVLISFLGLVYLVYPTLTTPSLTGFLLMGVSGIAWAMYTLSGRGSIDPLRDTACNFKCTVPFVLLLLLITFSSINISFYGVLLAVVSGAFASALGYTLWYLALRDLSEIEAGVVQLSVPVIAAVGGVVFVAESISMRLLIACILVLGGIFTVLLSRWRLISN